MKKFNNGILKTVDDECWRYAFTITTNLRFSDHNSFNQNNDIIRHWIINKVIKVLSNIIKDIVNNNPKYKHIRLKDLRKLSDHILLASFFEHTALENGNFIHFHCLSSRFIVPHDDDYTTLLEQLENNVYNVYYKQLNNQKKLKNIIDFKLDPYIQYEDLKQIQGDRVGDWRLYITKNMNEFPFFFSKRLNRVLNNKEDLIIESYWKYPLNVSSVITFTGNNCKTAYNTMEKIIYPKLKRSISRFLKQKITADKCFSVLLKDQLNFFTNNIISLNNKTFIYNELDHTVHCKLELMPFIASSDINIAVYYELENFVIKAFEDKLKHEFKINKITDYRLDSRIPNKKKNELLPQFFRDRLNQLIKHERITHE